MEKCSKCGSDVEKRPKVSDWTEWMCTNKECRSRWRDGIDGKIRFWGLMHPSAYEDPTPMFIRAAKAVWGQGSSDA